MSNTDKTQQMLIITQKIKELIIAENIEAINKLNNELNLLYKPIDANNLTILHFAVQMSRMNVVAFTADLMCKSKGLEVKDLFGRTPLHQAAAKGNVNIIQILIDNHADVNAVTISGETPLMKAIAFYQIKAIYLLLRNGGDPYMKNNVTGMNCFEQAKETRNDEIIILLEKYKDIYKKVNLIKNMNSGDANKEANHNYFKKFNQQILGKIFQFLIPW